jgi:hypothetical protein
VADSGALRVRRARLHKSGDHSLCRRCSASVPQLEAVPSVPDGEVTDAPLEMRRLAFRLAEAHKAEPGNGIVARELRMTLQALGAKADDGLGELYEALREA